MSRVGRDYLQTGFYTEVFFRQYGVHFVAVANNVDSFDQSSSEFAPFLNIMNEWYLRDQSRKVIAACNVKGSAGKPLTNSPPYGYMKDPADKNRWLIDEEAAAVVRRIFRLATEGNGPYAISRILTADQVDSPSVHGAKHGRGPHKTSTDPNRPHDWYGFTVSTILARPEYLGHTVNFRSCKASYKNKAQTKRPPEEWRIFENTHEAIIDAETWKLAQQARKTVRRTGATGEANPLTGLVFCADCGARMYYHRGKRGGANGRQDGGYYNCSAYTLTREREIKGCRSHSISNSALRALILDALRLVGKSAIADEAAFTKRVRTAAEAAQTEGANERKRSIAKAQRRAAELDLLIKKLYEAYAAGKLPENRFEALSADYECEQAELTARIASEQSELDAYSADTARTDLFFALAQKYADFSELTTPMIFEFIDRIVVHAPQYVDGERTQDVEIHLKYVGRLTVAAPEPTPEEIEAEARRKKRAKQSHAAYLKRKERLKQSLADRH